MRAAIAHTELYSYLVTRHTGRTVRTNIERQLAELEGPVLAVLDLRHVPLIDFSCADEVVAKLVVLTVGPTARRWFVLFRGLAEHHLEPIEAALKRQGLVAAAETVEGEPCLIGAVEAQAAQAWREIWSLGHAAPSHLAEALQVSLDAASGLLDELEARALVLRDGEVYVSFGRALRDAAPDDLR